MSFGGQPIVAWPYLGPTTIPALILLIIRLTLSATATVPPGIYKYFLNITDTSTGTANTWA